MFELEDRVLQLAIKDDPVVQSNKRGYITFAMAGPNTRTSQVFINFNDNTRLNASGFSPFGQVVSGMDVVDKLNPEYGEGAPGGRGPDQSRMQREGNAYLAQQDYERAIADFDMAVKLNPKHAEAFFNRGMAKQNHGDLAGGGTDIAQAKELQPGIGATPQ